MGSVTEQVRQLAPHWAVMFVVMVGTLAGLDRAVGDVGAVASVGVVLVVAFGYPFAVRALGVAPPIWQR
jgi:hypothetical protein